MQAQCPCTGNCGSKCSLHPQYCDENGGAGTWEGVRVEAGVEADAPILSRVTPGLAQRDKEDRL